MHSKFATRAYSTSALPHLPFAFFPTASTKTAPPMAIHDFGDDKDGLYRGVGSQLLYNRQSKQSLFIGALNSDKWLTMLRLHALSQRLQPTKSNQQAPPSSNLKIL